MRVNSKVYHRRHGWGLVVGRAPDIPGALLVSFDNHSNRSLQGGQGERAVGQGRRRRGPARARAGLLEPDLFWNVKRGRPPSLEKGPAWLMPDGAFLVGVRARLPPDSRRLLAP